METRVVSPITDAPFERSPVDRAARWKRGWPAAAALAAIALMTWQPAQISDGWMYASTGRWIVDNHAVPYQDTMTWTFNGQPWQSNGWLFAVLMWALMTAGGFAAYAVVKPVAVVLVGLSLRWTALQYGASRTAASAAMVVGPLLLLVFILERPQLATFVFTPLVLGLGRRAMGSGRMQWRWTALTAGAFALWANLHSGALFGVLLLASAVLGMLLHERWWASARLLPRTLEAAALVASSGLATLLTPYGFELWRYSNHVRDVSSAYASEWWVPWRQDSTVAALTLGLIGAVVLGTLWLRLWRRLDLFVPVVLSVALALQAFRNAAPLILVATAMFAPALPDSLLDGVRLRADLRRVAAVAMLVIALPIGVRGILASGEAGTTIPVESTAALPAGCRLANDSYVGNWVLWTRQDVPTSVDGRNDLYGRDLRAIYWFKTPGDQTSVIEDFREAGVDCVLAKSGSPIATALDDQGWQTLTDDGVGVALVAPA
jgi:hypothetical protein